MAAKRTPQPPLRSQPKRSAGPPRPVYVPEAARRNPKNRTRKVKFSDAGSHRNQKSGQTQGLGVAKSKSSQRTKQVKKKSSYARLGSMDSVLLDPSGDLLRRQDRWIPELGQRPPIVLQPAASLLAPDLWTAYAALDDYMYKQAIRDNSRMATPESRSGVLGRGNRAQPIDRPNSVDWTLWNVYRMLDAWVYRAILSAQEVVTYPLMDEVMDYQCEGGETPPPAPQGWKWVDRELVPTTKGGDTRVRNTHEAR